MSMVLDVASIREAYRRIDRTDAPAAFAADDAYRIVAPVELRASLHKNRERVRLDGTVRTTLELDCSRCLEGFRVPVEAAFDVAYLPATIDPQGAGEREVEENDLDTAFYRDGVIDLSELVREQLFLALPMKPLCSEACRGLCPDCGTNLNTGSCSCAREWEDPRLAPLKALARKNDDA